MTTVNSIKKKITNNSVKPISIKKSGLKKKEVKLQLVMEDFVIYGEVDYDQLIMN